MLFFESGEDGSIFDFTQLVESYPAFGARGASFEQFGWA